MRVAVAGAGPAGLASALYLTRAGHEVTIFDQFAAPEPVGSGLMIQPVGAAVLRDLGRWERLSGLGQRLERLEGRDARSGRLVLDVSYKYLGNGQAGLGVHRAALFGVLFDAVKAAGIAVETGCAVAEKRQIGGEQVLQFSDGTESAAFELIVDCMGSGSPLRKYSHAPGKAHELSYGALWATLDWRDGFEVDALNQRYDAASVMIGVMPVGRQTEGGNKKAAFFWSCKHAEASALHEGGLDAWKAVVMPYWPETGPLLDQIGGFEQMVLARYRHVTMDLPFGDGIILVGDSAHSTSPQLGQGANMALLDAKALELAMREGGGSGEIAARYAALRRFHVRLYQALSWTLTPFYQSDSRGLAMLRDLVVALPARLPPAQWLLAQMVAGTLGNPLRRLGLDP